MSEPPQLQALVGTKPVELYMKALNRVAMEDGDDIAIRAARIWAVNRYEQSVAQPLDIAHMIMRTAPQSSG